MVSTGISTTAAVLGVSNPIGGAIFGMVGGFAGGFLDQKLIGGLFSRSVKPTPFQGAQGEAVAPGTPYTYCVGRFNRIAGQRLWNGDLIRERPAQQPTTKRGDVVPEIVRADFASGLCAHAIHAVERSWWDGSKVYDANPLSGDVTANIDQLITIDWWSAFRPNATGTVIIQWHLIIDTVSDSSGRALPGVPDLSQYSPLDQVSLTLTDSTHGVQVSRKQGSATQTPWLVVSSEELPKGNSRLVLDLLFDNQRPERDFGWYDTYAASPGPARSNGPFGYPPTAGSPLLIEHTQSVDWKRGILQDPATDFEVRLGAVDQDQFDVMLASLGSERSEHFPSMAAVALAAADVGGFGSRVPNTEWLVSTSATDVFAAEAVDRVMGDRLGFRNTGFADPEFDPTLLYNPPAGLTAPRIDGYQWAAGLTGYEVIQPLMLVAGVRARERSGRVIFDWNGRRDIADVVVGELDTRIHGTDPGDLVRVDPVESLEVPDRIDIHFSDVDNDGQPNLARGNRQGLSVNFPPVTEEVRLDGFAMSFEQAEGLAQDIVREVQERRDGIEVQLPLTWDYLEPGDVLRAAGNDAPPGGPWHLIIDQVQRSDLLSIQCFRVSAPPLPEQAAGSTFDRDQPRIESAGPLAFDVIDLGPLRDQDATTPGYYVAASRFAPSNTPAGGSIWRKEPGETNPHRVGPITELAIMGGTVYVDGSTNILGDAATDVIDETNSIDVDVFDGSLSSVTEAELLAGANRCVIGNEILSFRDAVALDTGPRRFRLSGLLRGRSGTAEATLGHQAGERFVFLGHRSDPLPLNFVPAQLTDVGTTHQVQAVHTGGSTDTVSEYPHPVEASTGRALPPYDLTADVQPNGDVVFSWFRRSRVAWDSLDEPPRLAAEERYELVLNGGARIQSVLGDPSDPANITTRTYTAAHQAADVVGISFTAEVRQVDPASGAGRTSSITVTP